MSKEMIPSNELPSSYQKPLPITARQPCSTIWTIAFLLSLFVRVPFWILYYLPRSFRQNPNWTWKNAFIVNIARNNFWFLTTLRLEKTAPVNPGGSSGPKELFERIEPVDVELLRGVTSPTNTSIRPEVRPGNWYPSRYDAITDNEKTVVLYFFGGAFVAGAHTADFYKGTLDVLLPALGNAKFLGVGYRLASSKGNHFPSQLIDAISAYQHLLKKGIAPSNIILVGDSAGGNIVLSLLRYIMEQPELNISLPAAAVLASAWVDLAEPIDKVESHSVYQKDALPRNILEWGVTALVPSNISTSNRYISPGLHPFKVPIPIHVGTDDGEIFFEANFKFAEGMRAIPGNDVKLYVNQGGCHAIYMVGFTVGFGDAVVRETESIRSFLSARNVV